MGRLLDDPDRFRDFSLGCGDDAGPELFLDFSRQRITKETRVLLADLAAEREVPARRAALFRGDVVNESEQRPALHTDARAAEPRNSLISEQRRRVRSFAKQFSAGKVQGKSGRPLTRIINIGIGGSDLGARLLCSSLADENSPRVDFVSEMDGAELERALTGACPDETLFVVCSKSFATTETLANAYTARHWLVAGLGEDAPRRHFAAVSSNPEAMTSWGIAAQLQFRIPQSVGGRYSIWSAAGLSAWLSLGSERMGEFLAGGEWLDRHFLEAPGDRNLPILMALMALWNQSLLGCFNHLLLPYDTRLTLLPAYLQQLEMESLGKSRDASGRPLKIAGAAALLGVTGSSAQHSIMQWAQQGGRAVSADFIAARRAGGAYPSMHSEALRQMMAQAEALARGTPRSAITADPLAPHKVLPGGRCSNVLLLGKLDASGLGALLALYEQKVFVQATLLGVNPFDQWGVEHAKRLAADPGAQPPLAQLLDD